MAIPYTMTPPTSIYNTSPNNSLLLAGMQNRLNSIPQPAMYSNNLGSGINYTNITAVPNTTPVVVANTPVPTATNGNWDNYLLNNQNGNLNFYDSPTMSKYGYGTTFGQDYFNQYGNPTIQKGLFGSETTSYDMGALAERMIADSPMLAEQVKSWTPEQYKLWASDPTKYNYSNVNTMQTQLDSALKAQQNNAWTPQNTLSAVQTGVGVLSSLANLYMGFKQSKLAEKQLNETLALQRANYRNTAKAMNAQYRDQMSGRGTSVMSGSAKRKLGQMYANRKVSETY